MGLYSFSKVQLYMQCPLKFRYKYVDKIPSVDFEENISAFLGKTVHMALEKMYTEINNMNTPTKDDVIGYFHTIWEQGLADLSEQDKTLMIAQDDDIANYKHKGEKYVANYYDRYYPPVGLKVIDTEANIIFDLGDDIKFRGYIDRLDKIDDTFIINDYKTNKNLPTQDKEQYIDQLTLYGAGVQQKYDKYFQKLKARLYFLHFDIVDEWEITQDKLNAVIARYKAIIQEIENNIIRYQNGDKQVFPTNEGPLCRFCEYQGGCPLYAHMGYTQDTFEDISPKTVATLVDEYGELSKEKSQIEQKLRNIKDILEDYIKYNQENGKDFSKLYGQNYKITTYDIVNYKINDESVLGQILKKLDLLDQSLEISRFKIKKLIDQGKLDISDMKDDVLERNVSKVFKAGLNKK